MSTPMTRTRNTCLVAATLAPPSNMPAESGFVSNPPHRDTSCSTFLFNYSRYCFGFVSYRTPQTRPVIPSPQITRRPSTLCALVRGCLPPRSRPSLARSACRGSSCLKVLPPPVGPRSSWAPRLFSTRFGDLFLDRSGLQVQRRRCAARLGHRHCQPAWEALKTCCYPASSQLLRVLGFMMSTGATHSGCCFPLREAFC